MVQRGKLARQRVGVVVGGGGRTDETDALGAQGQRRQQQQGVEQAGGSLLAALRADQGIGQEHRIELGGFGQARCIGIEFEIGQRLGIGTRMAPRALMVTAAHEEEVQVQLAWARHGGSL